MPVDTHPDIAAWQNSEFELGLLRFRPPASLTAQWVYPIPSHLRPLALFEADLLCLDSQSGELFVIDHEVRDRVFCKAARSQDAFVNAMQTFQAYFERCGGDEDYADDEAAGIAARRACAKEAGGSDYESFFCGLVGW